MATIKGKRFDCAAVRFKRVLYLIKSFAIFLDRVLKICELFIKLLKRKNIEEIIVFEGLPLPGKEEEQARRSRQEILVVVAFFFCLFCSIESLLIFDVRVRLANRKRADFLRQNGNTSEANKVLSGSVEVHHNLVLQFIHIRV